MVKQERAYPLLLVSDTYPRFIYRNNHTHNFEFWRREKKIGLSRAVRR